MINCGLCGIARKNNAFWRRRQASVRDALRELRPNLDARDAETIADEMFDRGYFQGADRHHLITTIANHFDTQAP